MGTKWVVTDQTGLGRAEKWTSVSLCYKALLPNFDDMASDDHVVEVVTQEVTRLFKRCESRLQKLGGPGAAAKDDERVARPGGDETRLIGVLHSFDRWLTLVDSSLHSFVRWQGGPGANGILVALWSNDHIRWCRVS